MYIMSEIFLILEMFISTVKAKFDKNLKSPSTDIKTAHILKLKLRQEKGNRSIFRTMLV